MLMGGIRTRSLWLFLPSAKVGFSPRMPRPGFPPRIPELIKTRQGHDLHGRRQFNTGAPIEELTGKTEQFIEDNSRNLIIAIAAVAVIIVAVVGYGKFVVEPDRDGGQRSTSGAPSSTS